MSLHFELKIDLEPRSITENYPLAPKESLGGYLNLPPSGGSVAQWIAHWTSKLAPISDHTVILPEII